jgi:hypothetical protein
MEALAVNEESEYVRKLVMECKAVTASCREVENNYKNRLLTREKRVNDLDVQFG